MKKVLLCLCCLCLLLGAVSCAPQGDVVDTRRDVREQIRQEDVRLNEDSGESWFTRYGTALNVLEITDAVCVDVFTTDALSVGFSLCFSEWNAQGRSYAMVEAVYPDGSRRLADLYELTGVVTERSIEYAYGRLSDDPRFAGQLQGEIANEYSAGVKEINVTANQLQARRFELLAEQSRKEGKLCYGTQEEIRLELTLSARGVENSVHCNTPADSYANGAYLMNYSYWVKNNDDGNLIVLNRKEVETMLYTREEGDLPPEFFEVYDDERLIYTLHSETEARGYGVYDSATQSNTVVRGDIFPIALCEETLYLQYRGEDGAYCIGTVSLDDPGAEPVLIPALSGYEGVRNGTASAALSPDGTRFALLENGANDLAQVHVFDVLDWRVTGNYQITARFCLPESVVFWSDDTVTVLCDRKFLCDDYVYWIDLESRE